MRALLILVALAACGKEHQSRSPDAAPVQIDAPAPLDGAPAATGFCLDKPTTGVPAAPTGGLPCELYPPHS